MEGDGGGGGEGEGSALGVAATDEMFALLDVWRLTPAQREREVELIRELDVIDAAKPPSLPKRRKRKKIRKRTRRRP